MTYPDRTKHWPAEDSAEYRESLGTSWAPSWTTVGRMRDVALWFTNLFILLMIGGAVLFAVIS